MYLRSSRHYKGIQRRKQRLSCLWLSVLVVILIAAPIIALQYRSQIGASTCQVSCTTPKETLQILVQPTILPVIAKSQIEPVSALQTKLIAALQVGNIEDAITIIRSIDQPKSDDIKTLSLGVRLMLDHLYIVDATDFEMPTIKAKMDQAIEVADKAIQANPDLPDGWVMKALALSWAFRNQEALPFIQRAREINAQNPGAMAIQAEIYTELRRYNEALQLVADAIEIAQASKPINRAALGRANYVKGNILQILGKTDDAIAAYESAWQISSTPFNPSDPWAVVPPGYILYQLGPIYLFQGKSKLALQRYTDALEIDKQDPFLYYLRGRVYRFLGQPDKANAEFQLCLKLDSLQFRCSRNLGQMAYAQQDWRTTIRYMKPIIDENSQISDDYYYLAAAYVNSNLCEKAVTLLIRGFSLLKISTGQPLWKQADFFTLSQNCGVQLATP